MPEAELAADLVDTMRASPACVGLAASQIGVSKRAFALDVTEHPKTKTCHGLVVMFDPTIIEASGRKVGREGCMSVPDLTADVARATEIVVRAGRGLGRTSSSPRAVSKRGPSSTRFDHLDGWLILDRVESLATDVFRRKVYK